MIHVQKPKLAFLPRMADIVNMILPSWPVMRSGADGDLWNPETHDDARLAAPKDSAETH